MKLFLYFCTLLVLILFSGCYFLSAVVFHTTGFCMLDLAPRFSLLTSLSPPLIYTPFHADVIQFKSGFCTDGICVFKSAYLCKGHLKFSMSRTELKILSSSPNLFFHSLSCLSKLQIHCLGPKYWNYLWSFLYFSLLTVDSFCCTFKIYPESDLFSPPLLLP